MATLTDPPYLQFPLDIGAKGPRLANRGRHVRDQIEQVLLTIPGERVFRPEYGVGVKALVFEPDAPGLRELARTRILGALTESLSGEVDPRSLSVTVDRVEGGHQLEITVSYTLAALGRTDQLRLLVGPPG